MWCQENYYLSILIKGYHLPNPLPQNTITLRSAQNLGEYILHSIPGKMLDFLLLPAKFHPHSAHLGMRYDTVLPLLEAHP